MRIKSKLTNDVVFNTSNSVALVAGVVVKKVRKEELKIIEATRLLVTGKKRIGRYSILSHERHSLKKNALHASYFIVTTSRSNCTSVNSFKEIQKLK